MKLINTLTKEYLNFLYNLVRFFLTDFMITTSKIKFMVKIDLLLMFL